MKKMLLVLFALTLLAVSVSAAVPICVLGGPNAMDPNRQLAEGESVVATDRPLVVNLRFKPTAEHPEQVGECMLPKGIKVVQKNGILRWVLACGNDEVNQNIVVAPVPMAEAIRGLKGDPGPEGPQGPRGEPGDDFAPQPSGFENLCLVSTPRKIGCAVIAGFALYGGYKLLTPESQKDDPDGNTGGAFSIGFRWQFK